VSSPVPGRVERVLYLLSQFRSDVTIGWSTGGHGDGGMAVCLRQVCPAVEAVAVPAWKLRSDGFEGFVKLNRLGCFGWGVSFVCLRVSARSC